MSTKYQVQLQEELFTTTIDIKDYLKSQSSEYDQTLLCALDKHMIDEWPEILETYCPPELKSLQKQLSLVLAALSQLTIGMYGYCAKCDELIEEDVLEQKPTAQYCSKCSKKNA